MNTIKKKVGDTMGFTGGATFYVHVNYDVRMKNHTNHEAYECFMDGYSVEDIKERITELINKKVAYWAENFGNGYQWHEINCIDVYAPQKATPENFDGCSYFVWEN